MSIPTFNSYDRGSPSTRANAGGTSGGTWEPSSSEQDERIRLLTRLSDKLLSNREFEEKERYINELAKQEAEIQHLKEKLHEQAQLFDDRNGVVKMHETTIQQLQMQLVEARQDRDNQSRNLDSTVSKLSNQVRELETQRGELTRRYESQIQQLQREIELLKSRGGGGSSQTSTTRSPNEDALRQQLAVANEENSRLKTRLDTVLQTNVSNSGVGMFAPPASSGYGMASRGAKSSAVAPKTDFRGSGGAGDDDVLIEEVAEEPVTKIERPQATPISMMGGGGAAASGGGKPAIPDEF